MTIDLSKLPARPAGFGRCRECAYLATGTPAICYECLTQTVSIPDAKDCCDICSAPYDSSDGECHNPVCGWFTRQFDKNYVVAFRRGAVKGVLDQYKLQGIRGWSSILGRILVGFLNSRSADLIDVDLIVANPKYVDKETGAWDHNRLVIKAAARVDTFGWPFDLADPAAIIKTAETPSMKCKTWRARKNIADTDLRPSLCVPDSTKTREKNILVFDDLFTTGLTLEAVADCLRTDGGARSVRGISFARQVH